MAVKRCQWHKTANGKYPRECGIYLCRIQLEDGRIHEFENEYSKQNGFSFDNTMRLRGSPMRVIEWYDGWER